MCLFRTISSSTFIISGVQQIYTPSKKSRIDTGRTKFDQKTDCILSVCGSYGQRTHRYEENTLGSTVSCFREEGMCRRSDFGKIPSCKAESSRTKWSKRNPSDLATFHDECFWLEEKSRKQCFRRGQMLRCGRAPESGNRECTQVIE